jgi:hypothetical protein
LEDLPSQYKFITLIWTLAKPEGRDLSEDACVKWRILKLILKETG